MEQGVRVGRGTTTKLCFAGSFLEFTVVISSLGSSQIEDSQGGHDLIRFNSRENMKYELKKDTPTVEEYKSH